MEEMRPNERGEVKHQFVEAESEEEGKDSGGWW